MNEPASKKILDSALAALLQGIELSPWVKVPTTFIAELSKRFSDLPPDEKKELAETPHGTIMQSIPATATTGTSPTPDVLAGAIRDAVARTRLLDYLHRLTSPALNDLISQIDGARGNVSDVAPLRTQVVQLVEWVESSEGPGLSKLAGIVGPGF